VDDQLEELSAKLHELTVRADEFEERWGEEKQRNDELARILERVVEIGLRGGWAEFQDTPLQLPRIQLVPQRPPLEETPSPDQNPTLDN